MKILVEFTPRTRVEAVEIRPPTEPRTMADKMEQKLWQRGQIYQSRRYLTRRWKRLSVGDWNLAPLFSWGGGAKNSDNFWLIATLFVTGCANTRILMGLVLRPKILEYDNFCWRLGYLTFFFWLISVIL